MTIYENKLTGRTHMKNCECQIHSLGIKRRIIFSDKWTGIPTGDSTTIKKGNAPKDLPRH